MAESPIKQSEIKKAWVEAGNNPLVLTAEDYDRFTKFGIKYIEDQKKARKNR